MKILVTDRQSYEITRREFTDQGYLRVPGRVARTGIQHYLAKELQLTDRKPDEVVAVYRPPEEVFSPDSLATYKDVDATDDHPLKLVDAKSFKKVAVGHTTDAAKQEADFVVVDLIFKDQSAIDAIQSGKCSLSAGYEAEYHYEPGTTADGEPYEFVQRNIRINHIALVDRARAGQEAKLYDHKPRGKVMATVTLDGQTVEVEDKSTAQLIQRAFDEQGKSVKEMEAKAKEMEDEAAGIRKELEEAKASSDAKDEELEKAKKESSDSAIAERIKGISEVKDAALKVAGPKFSCDSLDPLAIKREALKVSRPTVDWAEKSEHYVQAAWDMAVESADSDPVKASHDRLGDDLKKHYIGDNGTMKGTEAYSQFLSGGKH